MREAAALLVGRHDFAAFSANPDRPVDSTVRTLRELRVTRRGREVEIVARADGFLYRMVRSLAGFLIRVGQGTMPPGEARRILASGARTARVETAAAQGLFLWNVSY
jgi:tRNA pseudouridine38-40 synthase